MADGVAPIEHGTLIDWVEEFDEGSLESRNMAERSRAYYDGDQWTEAEKKKLRAQKQAATVVNRVKPKIDGLLGMERSNRTTAKAFPRTPKHDKASEAATEAIRYVLKDNDYSQIRSLAWENMTVEGTGGVEVNVKEAKDGKIKIVLHWIPWDRIIYDPRSRRKDFKDSRYWGQFIWLDYDIAYERFPDGHDVLDTMIQSSGSSTFDDKPRWLDTKRRRVRVVELYYLEHGEIQYSCFTRGGELKPKKVSPFKNEEGETESPYEFASIHISLDNDRYGAAWQYLDVQDEINKRRSKALHLMSVRQVMLERGATDDINKVRQELAKPDGVVEVTPGMLFEVLKTGDMAAAQFNLLTEAKLEIDAVGYSAAASGKESRNMSGVALRNREAASQTELAPMFDVLKNLDIRVYRKIWNRIKQYWKDEMWIRVTDDKQNLRWVGLNAPMTRGQMMLEEAQAKGMPPEQLQQLAMQVKNDPMSQEVVNTQNDIAELDADIILDEAPDAVTMEVEAFQAVAEMTKSGVPPQVIAELWPFGNKDQIKQALQSGAKLPPEAEEQMKKMAEENKKLAQENQALKADQQTEMAKLQQKQAAEAQQLQMKAAAQAEELRLERERMEAEIRLEREKAAAEIEIMRSKALGEIATKMATIDAQKDAQEKGHEIEKKKVEQAGEIEREKKNQAQKTQDEKTAMPEIVAVLKDFKNVLAEQSKPKPKGKRTIRLIKQGGQTVGAEVED